MSTRKYIAAVASVAILGSTIAIFNSSSHPRVQRTADTHATSIDGRPVKLLDTVVVYATPLPHDTVGNLEVASGKSQPGFTLQALTAGSQLYMPYYSFASNLNTMIKE